MMQTLTTNKRFFSLILLVMIILSLTGCGSKKVRLSEIFQSYNLNHDEQIFETSKGKIIESELLGTGIRDLMIDKKNRFITYEIQEGNKWSGQFLVLAVKNNPKKNDFIIKDIIFIDAMNGLYPAIDELSYGEKNHNGYFSLEKTKFGIYDIDISKGLPFYKKIVPRYIISIDEQKSEIKVEIPQDDYYFIYLYDEI